MFSFCMCVGWEREGGGGGVRTCMWRGLSEGGERVEVMNVLRTLLLSLFSPFLACRTVSSALDRQQDRPAPGSDIKQMPQHYATIEQHYRKVPRLCRRGWNFVSGTHPARPADTICTAWPDAYSTSSDPTSTLVFISTAQHSTDWSSIKQMHADANREL